MAGVARGIRDEMEQERVESVVLGVRSSSAQASNPFLNPLDRSPSLHVEKQQGIGFKAQPLEASGPPGPWL